MSPRARGTAPEGSETPETPNVGESADDGLTVFADVVTMEPPARKRKAKHVLSDEQLLSFATAIIGGSWAGTGETFNGDEGEKLAGNKARVWRREVSRFLKCEERDIKTRIWETADKGFYTCAIKLRDGATVALPTATDADDNGEDAEAGTDTADADAVTNTADATA